MRQVHNALVFDTETANVVGVWNNGLGKNDFNHRSETLYRTQSGRWFLHGQGGAMTRWRRPAGNLWQGGEGLLPLDADEALGWCETHEIDVESVLQWFEVGNA